MIRDDGENTKMKSVMEEGTYAEPGLVANNKKRKGFSRSIVCILGVVVVVLLLFPVVTIPILFTLNSSGRRTTSQVPIMTRLKMMHSQAFNTHHYELSSSESRYIRKIFSRDYYVNTKGCWRFADLEGCRPSRWRDNNIQKYWHYPSGRLSEISFWNSCIR